MKPKLRYQARYHAVQALYQVLFTEDDAATVTAQHLAEIKPNKIDADYFIELVKGVLREQTSLDKVIEPFATRSLDELTPIELCVLRLAAYEFLHSSDVPYKVVINEALELNKAFGTQEGYRFVNGVLDQLGKKLRASEL